MVQVRKRHKPLYKKFLRLRVNPLNNNKFLKLKVTKTQNNTTKKFLQIEKFKKQKWTQFLTFLKRKNKFYKRLKPYTFYSYTTSKFASTGNSFKRKFRNDLLAKKTFNYLHGGLPKKYLKKHMAKIYKSRKLKSPIKTCVEFFESRLDVVIYRSNFSYSIKNAGQLIAHKHVKVNNRIEKNKSYILKQGDLITINPKSVDVIKENFRKQFVEKLDLITWPIPPSYLNINYNTLEIIFGDVENFNFATSFNLKIDTNSVVTNYYRH